MIELLPLGNSDRTSSVSFLVKAVRKKEIHYCPHTPPNLSDRLLECFTSWFWVHHVIMLCIRPYISFMDVKSWVLKHFACVKRVAPREELDTDNHFCIFHALKQCKSCTYSRLHRLIHIIVHQNRQKPGEHCHQHAKQKLTLSHPIFIFLWKITLMV